MSGRLPSAETIARLARALNMTVNRHPSGLKYHIQLPGFSYNDFDRKGHVNAWKICRILETERMENLSNKSLLKAFSHGIAPMMFCQNASFSYDIYKRASLHLPMKMNFALTEVGTSSLVITQSLVDDSDGSILTKSLRKVVAVNLATKRPTELPPNFIDQAQRFMEGEPDAVKFHMVAPLTVPPGAHKSHATVELEDCDFMYHVNQGHYLYYALNALGRAVHQGALAGLHDDIANYGVKTLDCLHTGEGFPDDKLEVYTWQPTEDNLAVNVAICKQDVIMYHALFTLHEKPIAS